MTNNRNYYATSSNYADHSTFGGIIYFSDFNTEFKKEPKKNEGSSVAASIMSDMRFDRMCKVNAENRDKNKEYNRGI